MITAFLIELLVIIQLLISGAKFGAYALSSNYYAISCPFADLIVSNIVNQELQKDPTLAAALLRMHFHDCFVQGCDGSVLIDSTSDNTAEKDSPANGSLRGYEIIDKIKQALENQCPGVVSCADILALAARDAVFGAGGPYYDVPKGRRDGRRSKIEDTINLPSPFMNSSALVQMFNKHGFNVQDLVALSGGHTLGVARCSSFKSRLSKFDSQNDVDPSLDSSFANTLTRQCNAGDNTQVALDWSNKAFDNAYYNALQRGMGVLFSDQTLYVSSQTRQIVNAYALNEARFFFDFQQAVLKMGSLDTKEGKQGEIRINCHKVN